MLIYPYGDIVYSLLIIIGIIIALLVASIYLKKQGFEKVEIIDLLLTLIGTVLLGFVFAFVFQTIYDVIKEGSSYKFAFKMTFYGGLIGGVLSFFLLYNFYYRKRHKSVLKELLIIAPGSVCIAHSLGRFGCFVAGCCYGKETSSIIGIIFPVLNDGIKRIPTQLIEAVFLLIIGVLLIFLAFKTNFKYESIIYLSTYSIFRFVLEFYRDDNRGGIPNALLSPSQIISIIIFILIIPIFFIIRKYIFRGEKNG